MGNNINRIELQYFEECPSWKKALSNLEAVAHELEIKNRINLISVETQEDAIKYEFTGSPTIKVNGKDIFPTEQNNYALGCRLYNTPEGYKGSPTEEMISKRLSEFT